MCFITRISCPKCYNQFKQSLSSCPRLVEKGYLYTVPINLERFIRTSLRSIKGEERIILDLNKLLPANVDWSLCPKCCPKKTQFDSATCGKKDPLNEKSKIDTLIPTEPHAPLGDAVEAVCKCLKRLRTDDESSDGASKRARSGKSW